MNAEDINRVRILRTHIAVGYMEGLEVLRHCEGDIGRSVALLQQRYIAAVETKTRLRPDVILPVLKKYHYDQTQTINVLEQQYRLINGVPHSETVFTLHRWRSDKAHAVSHIASEIERANDLKPQPGTLPNSSYWYSEQELLRLDTYHICVVALAEWMDYEYGEGLEQILHYHTGLVAVQLQKIGLEQMAQALLFAEKIARETEEKYPGRTEAGFTARYTALKEDTDYQTACDYIESRLSLITESLFDFIEKYADRFP